ncbi:MAG TPA: sigma-70 family RNA polymerase sigma factor [Gammaproteobacteria bacterium]|nr:sigma-70 family RNA polymerase sigma factor [Gammaproteobacteria bacterium]
MQDADPKHELLMRMLAELRPRLHRYCARMTGSAVDGEDVVQETLLKVLESPPDINNFSMLERWLIRVAHNASIDFLRRRNRQEASHSSEDLDMLIDPAPSPDTGDTALVSLRTFMRLPALQRSTVIFKDVLGYSLEEAAEFTGSSVAAVKSALQRGRQNLRELAVEPDDAPLPVLDAREQQLLAAYAANFNARNFEAVRAMLAEEMRFDLVNRVQSKGKSSAISYFSNYGRLGGWHLVPGLVDRRPALLAMDPDDMLGAPIYFVILEWSGDRVVSIRDFRYARYCLEAAEIIIFGQDASA